MLIKGITILKFHLFIIHHKLGILFLQGANIDSVDIEGRSPLLLATSCASWKIVNLLLSKGKKGIYTYYIYIYIYFLWPGFIHVKTLRPTFLSIWIHYFSIQPRSSWAKQLHTAGIPWDKGRIGVMISPLLIAHEQAVRRMCMPCVTLLQVEVALALRPCTPQQLTK